MNTAARNIGRETELAEEVRLEGMRAVIARRLTESLQSMAQLTLHREVQTAKLVEFRDSFAADSRPSVNDVVLLGVARVLARHPLVNATLERETIFRWRCVHLGMAVALDEGLVVPVIRNADKLSLANLQEETARLGRAAREGALTMSDLHDGTFTVSNLGAFGIDAFTPIINPPQVAILGVGRADRGSMTLSLTIDHRALDGVTGARFLHDLAEVLGHPSRHL